MEEIGVSAKFIHKDRKEDSMCLKQVISGDENVKLVYITPEKII